MAIGPEHPIKEGRIQPVYEQVVELNLDKNHLAYYYYGMPPLFGSLVCVWPEGRDFNLNLKVKSVELSICPNSDAGPMWIVDLDDSRLELTRKEMASLVEAGWIDGYEVNYEYLASLRGVKIDG